MTFKKYPKVYRVGTEETEGVLQGQIYIFEKIDGANAQIYLKEGQIRVGSHNHEIEDAADGFRGFVSYVNSGKYTNSIREFFNKYPNYTLYGEYLVSHHVKYGEDFINNFYVFDVYDHSSDTFMHYDDYSKICEELGLLYIKCWFVENSPDVEKLQNIVKTRKSDFEGDQLEGIVIKNYNFRNQFGRLCHAKIVNESFKEIAINRRNLFKGADNEFENILAEQGITKARVFKIVNKIMDETGERVTEKQTARIIETAYHDWMVEEIYNVVRKNKKATINFSVLEKLMKSKAREHFFNILASKV